RSGTPRPRRPLRGEPPSRRRNAVRTSQAMHLDQELPEAADAPFDLGGRLAVSAAAPRQTLEAERLAPGDRDRMEVADLPCLRAVDRAGHNRDVLLQGDHRRAWHRLPRDAGPLPRPLDEEAERVAVVNETAHRSHGLTVRFTATDRRRAEGADQGRERG